VLLRAGNRLPASNELEQIVEPITVYSAAWCPDCWRVKMFLKERGVKFQEVNIDRDPESEEIVIRVNKGKRKIPTLKIGDRYFACSPFSAYRLAEELKIALNK
jgi:glutaredoxin